MGFQEVLTYGRKSGVQLGDHDTVAYAETFGAHGCRVGAEDEFGAALRQALSEDGSSLINVPVDYRHTTDPAADLHQDPFE
ncbi:thiamine pyrophosphate-dependent enzyme [Streptomyces sp. NPDC006923]|uniref:thiamine pyrophosphate-dependent enzyme n=1 Tax=Streptomyces sp. NPDC006923 TaxID=3155355 RepID=UPI0033D6AABC